MATVRELITRLGFDVDTGAIERFESGLQRAKATAQSVGDSMMQIGKAASVFLTAPLVAAGTLSLKTVGEFEQLNVAMTTMLGSAEKAQTLIKQLFDFAAKTPFEIKGIQESAKSLLAFGIEQDKIIPTLKSLGDVAAGLGIPLDRLVLNYGQVKTQTKLTGVELKDFQRAGVPVLTELAKNLGKSEAQIQDMVSAGKIGFKDVEKAFITLTAEGGRFNNLMVKQSTTLLGTWSNFKDQLTLTSAEIGQVLLPYAMQLLGVLQKLLGWFRALTDEQKKWIVGVGAFLAAIGPILIALGVIIKLAVFLGPVFAGIAKIATGIWIALKGVWVVAQFLYIAVKALLLIFGGIPVLIGAAVIAAVALVYIFRDEIVDALTTAWNWVADGAVKLWGKVKDLGIAVFEAIKAKARETGEFLVDMLTGAKFIRAAVGFDVNPFRANAAENVAALTQARPAFAAAGAAGSVSNNSRFDIQNKIEVKVNTDADPDEIAQKVSGSVWSVITQNLRAARQDLER